MPHVQPLRTEPDYRQVTVGAFGDTVATTALNVDVYVLLVDRATGYAHVLAGDGNAGALVVERGRLSADGRGVELLEPGSEIRMDGRPRIVTDAP